MKLSFKEHLMGVVHGLKYLLFFSILLGFLASILYASYINHGLMMALLVVVFLMVVVLFGYFEYIDDLEHNKFYKGKTNMKTRNK